MTLSKEEAEKWANNIRQVVNHSYTTNGISESILCIPNNGDYKQDAIETIEIVEGAPQLNAGQGVVYIDYSEDMKYIHLRFLSDQFADMDKVLSDIGIKKSIIDRIENFSVDGSISEQDGILRIEADYKSSDFVLVPSYTNVYIEVEE